MAHAYAQPTYAEAKAELRGLRADLGRLNESAVRSLDEGLEETLTVHWLSVGATLRRSLMTTNLLESVFSGVEQRTGKVDRWRSSNQKQRWQAAALLDIEPRLRRVRGYRTLPQLREAIQQSRCQPASARRRSGNALMRQVCCSLAFSTAVRTSSSEDNPLPGDYQNSRGMPRTLERTN